MTQPNYYSVIPANVRYDKDLSFGAKVFYSEITSLTNAEGYCWATNEYFAEIYDMSIRSIQVWVRQLHEKGYIRVELVRKGMKSTRKIYLNVTGEKNCVNEENCVSGVKKTAPKGEENCVLVREENFTHNNLIITNNKSKDNNTSNNKKINKKDLNSAQFENEFETLWKLYPRKMGKANALKSYIKSRKTNKVSYETIENGLYRYIDYLKQQGTEDRFILHGSTWFASEKWLDEYISVAPQKKIKNYMDFYQSEFGGERNGFEGNREVIDHDSDVISKSSQNYRGIEF